MFGVMHIHLCKNAIRMRKLFNSSLPCVKYCDTTLFSDIGFTI